MITPNVTGMSPRNLHAYKELQYYNKMPDKIKKYYSLKFSPTMFNLYLATISGLSLPSMLALPPPPRDPSVGSKRWREDLLPPCRDHNDDLLPPPGPFWQRQAQALNGTCWGRGLGTAFFPRQAAHRCVAPQRQKNSYDNDRGGWRRHECDNGCSRQ